MNTQTKFLSASATLATALIPHAIQASADYPPAIWNPPCNANYNTSGSGHKFHVVHDIEGYYASCISMFKGCGYTAASVHYVVNGQKDATSDAPAGEITQMIRDAHYAWHVRCWNSHCTGTEHEGFASNPAWFTDALYSASAGVTGNLAAKFGWAKDRNHVIAHGQKSVAGWPSYASANLGIDPYCNTHTDPGPYWDWNKYMGMVNPPPPTQRIDVFVRGTDNALYTKPYDNNQWYPWARLGGVLTSDPSAVSWGLNRIDVFYRGSDNGLYNVSWVGNAWVWGQKLASNLAGSPDATSWGNGRIDVFWKGTDSAMHHRAYDNNQWYPEDALGGILTSDPSAVSWGPNRIDVYSRGTDNGLYPLSWTGTQWVWGVKLADNLGGGVDACSWGLNRIDLFWRGSDNTLRHRAYEGTQWYGESNLGGILTSDPGATTWGYNRIDVYTRGTDGSCVTTSWANNTWIWSNIGGGIIGGPDACSWSRW